MDRKKILANLQFLLPVPYLIGVVGYYQMYPDDMVNGFYKVFQLYTTEYDIDGCNTLLNISRWTAPAVTAAYIMTGLENTFFFLSNQWKKVFHKKHIMAVYGNNSKTEILIDSLDRKITVLEGKNVDSFHKVSRHVVMFENQEDNLIFFQKHKKDFQVGDKVFINLENFSPYLVQNKDFEIYPFSFTNATSISYMEKEVSSLCEDIFDKEKVNILLIGSGAYAEELLRDWLYFNIFHVKQEVTYHIIGDFSEFQGLHCGLPCREMDDYVEMTLYPKDKIRFYHGSWEKNIKNLMDLDNTHQMNLCLQHEKGNVETVPARELRKEEVFSRVVLCDSSDLENLKIADRILTYLPSDIFGQKIQIRLSSDEIYGESLQKMESLSVFGTYSSICNARNFLQEGFIDSAKTQFNNYIAKNTEAQEGNKVWTEIDAHERDSNLYSAQYRSMILPDVVSCFKKKKVGAEHIEFLAELEHIRWNRFHFLRNWQHCSTKKEKNQRIKERKHTDLIDYKDLIPTKQDYDRSATSEIKEKVTT